MSTPFKIQSAGRSSRDLCVFVVVCLAYFCALLARAPRRRRDSCSDTPSPRGLCVSACPALLLSGASLDAVDARSREGTSRDAGDAPVRLDVAVAVRARDGQVAEDLAREDVRRSIEAAHKCISRGLRARRVITPSPRSQNTERRTDTPPSGPWALRNPNSSSLQSGPAASRIRAAFVVTSDAKFTRFNSDVSSSCARPIGP